MPGNEVKIYRDGNKVILEPLSTTRDAMWLALDEFSDDFRESGREQPEMIDKLQNTQPIPGSLNR